MKKASHLLPTSARRLWSAWLALWLVPVLLGACGKQTFFSGGTKAKDSKPQVQIEDSKTTHSAGDASVYPPTGAGSSAEASGSETSASPQPYVEPESTSGQPGDKTSEPTTTQRELKGISVPYDPIELRVDERLMVPVTAEYSDGTMADVTADTSFETGKSTIATTVDGKPGEIIGVSEGDTVVKISHGGKDIMVPVYVRPFTVVSLVVSPDKASARVDETVAYRVTGRNAANEELDLTAAAIWESSEPTQAIFDEPKVPGQAHAVGAGEVTLTATYRTLKATGKLTVIASPGLVYDGTVNVRASSETQIGINHVLMRITNLREGDRVTPRIQVTTVDFKTEYLIGERRPSASGAGWFDQVIVLRIHHKHVPEVTLYREQKQSFLVTFAGGTKMTIDHVFSVRVVKTDETGKVVDENVTATFEGTAGHPLAMPTMFPNQ